MSDEVVNKDGALVVDMAQADALWNSLDPIKRAELTNMMFEPVLAKAKQQADRIEELEAKLAEREAAAYRKGQEDMQERAASVAFRAENWRVDASIRALSIKEKDDG